MTAAAKHRGKRTHHRSYERYDAFVCSKQVQLHPVTLHYIGEDADELEAGIRVARFTIAGDMVINSSLLSCAVLAVYFMANMSAAGLAFSGSIILGLVAMGATLAVPTLLNKETHPLKLYLGFHRACTGVLCCVIAVHAFLLPLPNTTTDVDAYEGLAANAAMVMLGNVLLCYYLHSPVHVKLLGGYAIPLAHTFRPLHGLGATEARLMWMGSLVGQVCGYFLERAQRTVHFEQQMQLRIAAANRKADSRLNHVVKGLCGGANGLLESLQVALKLGGSRVTANSDRLLQQVRDMLADASDWCHKRQIFVSLEARTYQSNRVECALSDMLNRLVGPVESPVESIVAARVDVSVLILSLQEALSNARKYRRPASKIRVHAELVDDQTLHVTIDSLNQKTLRRMSDEECKHAFAAGSKLSGSTYMSDGIGLDSVAAAVAAAHGRAWLSTSSEPDGDHTIFHVTLPAEACPAPTPTTSCNSSDTSEGSAGELIAHVADRAEGASVHDRSDVTTVRERQRGGTCGSSAGVGGSSSEGGIDGDAEGGGDAGHIGASGGAKAAGGGLCCFGVDDCPFLRAMHLVMFETFMGADLTVSRSVGATLEEALAFVDIALGRLDATTLKPNPPPHVHADVVVIDQNLFYKSETGEDHAFLGSDLAARLHEGGFTGVACILSGSSWDEIETLSVMPGVDIAYEKSASLNVIGSRIRAKLEEKRSI